MLEGLKCDNNLRVFIEIKALKIFDRFLCRIFLYGNEN
jgi:hypothetical protein